MGFFNEADREVVGECGGAVEVVSEEYSLTVKLLLIATGSVQPENSKLRLVIQRKDAPAWASK